MNYTFIEAAALEKLCREIGTVPEKRRRQIIAHIRDAAKGNDEASVQAIHSALLSGLEKDELVFLKRALGLPDAPNVVIGVDLGKGSDRTGTLPPAA